MLRIPPEPFDLDRATRVKEALAEQGFAGSEPLLNAVFGNSAFLGRLALRETGALDDGEKHTLIAACMVAMYLSKDSARTPAMRLGTRRLVLAGGSLPRVLLPILRLWRIAYSYRST